jgi:hypothetical protein
VHGEIAKEMWQTLAKQKGRQREQFNAWKAGTRNKADRKFERTRRKEDGMGRLTREADCDENLVDSDGKGKQRE